ncbi:MAG TPA: PilN domain-containing protein [Tepidisphaeraceae bacterium]|nr:PilN domain-containing protein [Tepidisphaeraceae bacterium]
MSSPNQLSFLPDDYLERKARHRANILCGVLAVIVLGIIVSAFWYQEKITRAVERRYNEVETKYAEAAKRIEKVNQMRSQQQQVVRRAELAASLVEKVPRSNILAEYANSLPAGLSLLSLQMESRERFVPPPPMSAFEKKKLELEGKSSPTPAPKVYDVYLKIEGVASTDIQVAQLMEKLKHSPLFKEVNLLFTEEYQLRDKNNAERDKHDVLRKFQIEMMLNPQAEVVNAVNPTSGTTATELGEDGPNPSADVREFGGR